MSINITNLFTSLGKIFRDQEVVNAFRVDTSSIANVVSEFDGESLNIRRALTSFQNADTSRQSALSASIQSAQQVAQSLVIEAVAADVDLPKKEITTSLVELIRQMIVAGDTVDESTTSCSVGSITGSSDVAVVAYMNDPQAKPLQYNVAEGVRVECTSATGINSTQFSLTGEIKVNDYLSQAWPGGSGILRSLTASTPATSLLTNSGFDTDDDIENCPDGWYASVATIGTTLKLTTYEVQEIVVTGPPTAGTYRISWANASGKVQVTTPLAYDADGGDVQDALRALVGLKEVEVTTTGTSPLYTHSIEFIGFAGNPAQFTIINNTTGGTYTPGTTTAGSANAFTGRAIEFDSDGSQLTTLNQAVALSPLTRYAFSMRALVDVVPAAGVITVDVVDGIGGSVLTDAAGNNLSQTFSCTAMTTSFVAKNFTFTTPQTLPPITYFRIRISTAVSSGTSVFIDHACLVELTELYAGGPCVAIFGGKVLPVAKSRNNAGDFLTLTVANNFAGKFQEYFERNFQMSSKRLRLPSNNAGAETIADTLIS